MSTQFSFYAPLKTQEKQGFSGVFEGERIGDITQKWFNMF